MIKINLRQPKFESKSPLRFWIGYGIVFGLFAFGCLAFAAHQVSAAMTDYSLPATSPLAHTDSIARTISDIRLHSKSESEQDLEFRLHRSREILAAIHFRLETQSLGDVERASLNAQKNLAEAQLHQWQSILALANLDSAK